MSVCFHIRSLGLGISTQVLFAMHASIGMETYAVLFFGTLFSCQGAQTPPGDTTQTACGHWPSSDRAGSPRCRCTPVLAHSVASSAATRHRAKRQRTGNYSRAVRLGQRIDKPDEAPLPNLNHCVHQDIPGDALVVYTGPVDADRPLFQETSGLRAGADQTGIAQDR